MIPIRVGEMRNANTSFVNPEIKRPGLSISGRTVLMEEVLKIWAGFIWFSTGYSSEFL
jgi:hypothetical protein